MLVFVSWAYFDGLEATGILVVSKLLPRGIVDIVNAKWVISDRSSAVRCVDDTRLFKFVAHSSWNASGVNSRRVFVNCTGLR